MRPRTRSRVRAFGDERGQMAVEMACLIPVAVVMALVIYNLMCYVEACAAFDRICKEAVLTQGVSPAGEQSQTQAVSEVETSVRESLGRKGRCEVVVAAEQTGARSILSGVSPLFVRYRCTLTYRPWPSSFSVAGVSMQAPLVLTHECELVVDRFRPGVVI